MEEEKTVNQEPETEKAENAGDAQTGTESAASPEEVSPEDPVKAEDESGQQDGGETVPEETDGASAEDGSADDSAGDGDPQGSVREEEKKEDPSGKGSFFRKKKDKKDEKIDELNDQLTRLMAEFENFRKRTDREKSQMFQMGSKAVIEKILPVVDNFERGLESAGEENTDPFVEGMRKTYRQLTAALESLGVKPIEAVGKPFDPQLHNAVMHCEDESAGENTVVQELQKGYMLNDTVIRHSMVKVAN